METNWGYLHHNIGPISSVFNNFVLVSPGQSQCRDKKALEGLVKPTVLCPIIYSFIKFGPRLAGERSVSFSVLEASQEK